jgi:hypothetical protein
MINLLGRRRVLAVTTLTLILSASFFSHTASAQESDNWKFRITPYFWLVGVDGTTAVLGNDVAIDNSFSDLLDALNLALSVNMELSKGKFFIVFDPMYAEFEADFTGPNGGPVGGTLVAKLVIADLNVGYNFGENFDLYAGVRYYDQDLEITPNVLPVVASITEDWSDFTLGLRFHGDVSDKWSYMAKLDGAVGGDSESAWYLQAAFLRHFGENKHLNLGWRYYDVDFETGSGVSRFKWDVKHSGPVVGFSWEFGG